MINFKLVREIIPNVSVKYLTLKFGYGYIKITNFQDNTTDDLLEALQKMESDHIKLKGLILDLRGNPGGLLDQAVSVADVFLEKGEIVNMKGRSNRHKRTYKANPNEVKRGYPIVLLINKGSAAGTEIVASALRDNKRALILGTTSYGLSTIQTVEPLQYGYGLKFTVAESYRPNGESYHNKGIEPDVKIGSSFNGQKYSSISIENFLKDNQVKLAYEILIKSSSNEFSHLLDLANKIVSEYKGKK